jgi:hypothetical protein
VKPRRRVIAFVVTTLLVLAAAGLAGWRTGWPPSVFGSGSALVQTQVDHVTAIGTSPGASWPPVAKDAYVSDLTAWDKLPAALRSSSLARLRTAERRFRAMGTRMLPRQPLVVVRGGPSPDATAQAAARGIQPHVLLTAARSGTPSGQVAADFGATDFRAGPLSFGPPGLWSWTPCVSITPLGGGRAVKVCGGKVLGSGGHSLRAGMAGSTVATIGEAAAQAYVPVTATYTNRTGQAQRLTINGSVASVSMTLDEPSLAAAGCNWSKLRYDTPATGVLSPPLPNPPLIDMGTCLSTFGLHIPLPAAYATKLALGMAAAHNIVNSVNDAYVTVADKPKLTSAPALEACASGAILSDLSAFFTDFGGIGAPSCTPTPVPTWTGTLGPGQALNFSFTPVTWAVDGGAGVEATAIFSFIHLHVASTPAQAAPALYVHNGITLGALFNYPKYPATIGLDNQDYLSGLHWTAASPGGVTATGTLNVNNCTPDCASGSDVKYPVELIAFAPQRCPVAVYQQYSAVPKQENAYVFNKIQLKALSGNPPADLVGFTSALTSACGSPVTVASAPCTPTALTSALDATNTQPGGWTVVSHACQSGYSFATINPVTGGEEVVAILQQQGTTWKVIFGPNEGLCLTNQNQSFCQGFKPPLPQPLLRSLMRQAGYG